LKVGRLVALGHHGVTSGPAIALEQAADSLQRLLVVTSRLPIRLVSDTHQEPPPSSGTTPQILRSRGPAVEFAARQIGIWREAIAPSRQPHRRWTAPEVNVRSGR
jgi:hypothetical protein